MMKASRILDIDLEKLLLGELGKERMDQVALAIEADPTIRARYQALKADNDAILTAYPPRVMAAQIAARLPVAEGARAAQHGRRLWLAMPVTAAAAVAAMLVYISLPGETIDPPGERPEEIRIKGDVSPALFVFRMGADKEETLKSGATAAEGDVVQIKYAARGATHGVIFSIDGRGTVTLHFPSQEEGDTRIQKGAPHALGFSYELDDAPRFERFFFVTSDKPLNVKQILARARELGPDETGKLALGKGIRQSDFLIKKPTQTR